MMKSIITPTRRCQWMTWKHAFAEQRQPFRGLMDAVFWTRRITSFAPSSTGDLSVRNVSTCFVKRMNNALMPSFSALRRSNQLGHYTSIPYHDQKRFAERQTFVRQDHRHSPGPHPLSPSANSKIRTCNQPRMIIIIVIMLLFVFIGDSGLFFFLKTNVTNKIKWQWMNGCPIRSH